MSSSTEATDPIIKGIYEDIPEVAMIKDASLRDLVVEAWRLSLSKSSFSRISDMPPAGAPGIMILAKGSQADHIRGVTNIAMGIALALKNQFSDIEIDTDIILAGGLCHDIGKSWEFDPKNRERWEKNRSRFGKPSLRHPAYGAHICLTAGLPEEIAHIASAHSGEGELLARSLANTIIHYADYVFWAALMASGHVLEDTIPASMKK